MPKVCCPVCGAVLNQEGTAWRCGAGHSFDQARQGYVNLLPVFQKHSKQPGDTREQVAARTAFLDAGYYAPIAETVCRLVLPEKPASVLDAGCGEGYYLAALGERLPDAQLWGVDISKEAVRRASVRSKRAHWLVATAAHLPFLDGGFDCLLSMFALTAESEFHRVLRPGGLFLQVLAGQDHLMALKRLIYPEILNRPKDLHPVLAGFRLEQSQTLEFPIALTEPQQILNLLAMTPHWMRITKAGADRARSARELTDTAQVVFNCYRAI